MSENEDDVSEEQSSLASFTSVGCCISAKSKITLKPERSKLHGEKRIRIQDRKRHKGSSHMAGQQPCYRTNLEAEKSDPMLSEFQNNKELAEAKALRNPKDELVMKNSERERFSRHDFIVNNGWSDEISVKFMELFKDTNFDEEDVDLNKKRIKFENGSHTPPPYTKEFHVLTEVQKARILKVIEDVIQKLAGDNSSYGIQNHEDASIPNTLTFGKSSGKKFTLSWVVIKIIEFFLIHIIQIIFLSDDTYFQRKSEFLPVVVTYYLTVFIVVTSLVTQLSYLNHSEIQNPCYIMGVVSSSVMTLITSLGLIVMLTTMEYYRTFFQLLVLVLLGVFLFLIFGELCLFYVEVKNVWNRVTLSDQFYDT